MDNKNHTVMHLVGLSSIALGLAFMISPNNHSALAQQLNSSNSGGNSSSGTNKTISITMTPNTQQQQQNPYSMSSMTSGLQNQNRTGSISLFSPIIDAFKSKIHTTLNDATTNAINVVSGGGAGSNASAGAVGAFIHPENGFLVYSVFVLDSSNNIHKVIVDPGNGKVLSNQQMSMMEMMFMMHPSMGMGMGGMMMGQPGMMMDNGMGMMQHGMMMGGGGPGMMMGPQHDMMMDRGMMDHGMGMMGWH
jgi:hypothetical protein